MRNLKVENKTAATLLEKERSEGAERNESNEMKIPLVPLMGYSEALMRLISQPGDDPAKEQKIAQMVGKFRGQLKHLSRLTDDLLDVARLQSGKFSLQEEPVNLAEVVEQAVEGARLISHAHTIQFEAPKMDRPLIVHGDKERLAQVMNNLMNNAIKYAPQRERIDVRLGRARGAKRMAQIEVQDYGQGIAEEDMEMIFKRFYQISADDQQQTITGLGLGLFIANGIIEQHGGSITARSEVGKGSTFVIRLPLTDCDNLCGLWNIQMVCITNRFSSSRIIMRRLNCCK